MTSDQLHHIRRRFLDYAAAYLSRSGEMVHMMELKREHCAFVARDCRALAEASGWPEEEFYAAEALGLLHDIGRFPQLEEYGTFMDAKSINHGERGWQAVREENLLNGVGEPIAGAILNGVRHHNAHTVQEGLPVEHYRWINLIRDADRLDIYRVVLDALENDKLSEHPEIGLGLSLEGDPSPALIEKIISGGMPTYHDLHAVADFLLLVLSWCTHMSYPATLKMIAERNVINRIAGYLPLEQGRVAEAVAVFKKAVDNPDYCSG